MVYDYIIKNYKNGEPIFLSELPGESKDYLRQEMKQLCDAGKLERLYNGVYYLSYQTILGTKGYSEISGAELVAKLKKLVETVGVDFSVVKEILPLYPDKVYRNIYDGGLMGELV